MYLSAWSAGIPVSIFEGGGEHDLSDEGGEHDLGDAGGEGFLQIVSNSFVFCFLLIKSES